ncbi:MAG TPA: DNA recombination protein RmuC [Agitococcus sp.]|nr:DNA recombination protein RmuC [Agitococcus sp.]
MDTILFVTAFVACVVFLVIGIVLGRSLSKTQLITQENQLKTAFEHEKQQQNVQLNSLTQALALAKQENQQLSSTILNHQQSTQQLQSELENLRNTHNTTTAKLSASLSNEQGLHTRLSERDSSIEQLNQTIITLRQEKNIFQEQIEQQKVQLGQAQEQQQQLERLHKEQEAKDALFNKQTDELTKSKSRIAELEMACLRDQEVITERNQTIQQLQLTTQQLNDKITQQNQTIQQHQAIIGQAQAEKEQLQQVQVQLANKDKTIEQLQAEATTYLTTIKELKIAAEKDAKHMADKLMSLENNKELLKQEFENLAHQIFESKQKNFSEQSQQGLNSVLNPLKEQLESFRTRVDQVHANSIEGQTNIKAELEKLRELNTRINEEAANLTKALKSDKKLQGSWGEQKVDLLLERAGLRKNIEYSKEENFKNDEGKNQRPDFVVKLPEGKQIIIDSKMSLVAYMEYVAADNDKARQEALTKHIKAVEFHINDLGSRQYHTLQGLNTPDFVFLFMPIEPAYILISEHAPELFEKAYEKNIAIVTAANLLPVLRVVANLWSIQRQNQTTKELADQASLVYNKLRIFIEKMEDLGKHIDKAQVSYRESFNSLKDGQGSLTKTVNKFVELGVKVNKQLPSSVLIEDLGE